MDQELDIHTKSTSLALESASADLLESLEKAGLENVLLFLIEKNLSDDFIERKQQRGEPDLTLEEKLKLLKCQLKKSPSTFLHVFGKFLSKTYLECFAKFRSMDDDVDSYFQKLENDTDLSPKTEKEALLIKNRRYEALQRMVDTTDYFTEEEMQRRNPVLYHQLIGQFHTENEREAFLALSAQSSSACRSGPGDCLTPLTDMLIAHAKRSNDGETGTSLRLIDQNKQIGNLKNIHEDNSEDSADEDQQPDQDQLGVEIDEDEKELFKEEFFTTMYRNFLEGKDEDFDYKNVDENGDYDIGEVQTQDKEDEYFDSEEPSNPEPKTTVSHSNLPLSSKFVNEEVGLELEGEDEDELDVYMKTIQSEIQNETKHL